MACQTHPISCYIIVSHTLADPKKVPSQSRNPRPRHACLHPARCSSSPLCFLRNFIVCLFDCAYHQAPSSTTAALFQARQPAVAFRRVNRQLYCRCNFPRIPLPSTVVFNDNHGRLHPRTTGDAPR
jgi:hypothetical protein